MGYVGLMKAISRFDPAAGASLGAYAQVCISGEIKRHFRDRCWPVHVSRVVQDLVLAARKATSQLTQDLGGRLLSQHASTATLAVTRS
jgi:RNA polymerase sigma-B factor